MKVGTPWTILFINAGHTPLNSLSTRLHDCRPVLYLEFWQLVSVAPCVYPLFLFFSELQPTIGGTLSPGGSTGLVVGGAVGGVIVGLFVGIAITAIMALVALQQKNQVGGAYSEEETVSVYHR
jgi:hypothetical protein